MDEDIHTIPLPPLHPGENILTITVPIGLRTNLEAFYLLGDFASGSMERKKPSLLLYAVLVLGISYPRDFLSTREIFLIVCGFGQKGAAAFAFPDIGAV